MTKLNQNTITVTGRDYELPLFEELTLGEMRTIRRLSGVNISGYITELLDGNPDVIAAIVLVVKRRAGEQVNELILDDLELGDIQIQLRDPGDATPPAEAAAAAADSAGDQEPTPAT